jgi:hypothetical protein
MTFSSPPIGHRRPVYPYTLRAARIVFKRLEARWARCPLFTAASRPATLELPGRLPVSMSTMATGVVPPKVGLVAPLRTGRNLHSLAGPAISVSSEQARERRGWLLRACAFVPLGSSLSSRLSTFTVLMVDATSTLALLVWCSRLAILPVDNIGWPGDYRKGRRRTSGYMA